MFINDELLYITIIIIILLSKNFILYFYYILYITTIIYYYYYYTILYYFHKSFILSLILFHSKRKRDSPHYPPGFFTPLPPLPLELPCVQNKQPLELVGPFWLTKSIHLRRLYWESGQKEQIIASIIGVMERHGLKTRPF